MRRSHCIIVLCLTLASTAVSQDMIITTSGDTIQCRITDTEADFYHFTIQQGDGYMNTLISAQDVERVLYANGAISIPDTVLIGQQASQFLLLLGGGFGKRTAKISSDFNSDTREYIEELTTGPIFRAAAYHMPSEGFGIGVLGSIFLAENEIASIGLADKIEIRYVGPSILTRIDGHSDQIYFFTSTSLGYLGYFNESKLRPQSFDIKAASLGLRGDLMLVLPVSESFGFTLGASYLIGNLSKFNVTSDGQTQTIELDSENLESLNRIDLEIGIFFGG